MRLATADRTLRRVVAVTLAALVARLAFLGSRVAHFDEGRVGYWTLEYARTGEYTYRAVLHGPLLQHVNRHLFDLLGPTDFAMRLFPAVVTGLLPLSVVLFRARLSNRELTALALLLAFEPLLLYYGRFSRSDPLVGAFAFVAFGLVVRAIDAERAGYLVPALGFLGLGLGAKENALLYPVAWLGAGLFLLDHRLLGSDDRLATLRESGRTVARGVRRGLPMAVGGLLLAFVVLFVMYAPRTPGPEPGIGALGSNPAALPALLDAAFVQSGRRLAELWLAPNSQFKLEFSYVVVAGALLKSLLVPAAPVTLLGVGGFLADRYRSAPRDLVQFAGAWALFSLVGYPAVADVPASWLGVHILLPLVIPAAVALAATYEVARSHDALVGRVATVTLVLVAASVAGVAGYTSYVNPDGSHELAQYSQPHGDFSGLRDDPDELLVYGAAFVDGDTTAPRRPPCVAWFETLPLGWYTERANTTVTCAANASELPDQLPPVVVAPAAASDGELGSRTAGWEVSRVNLRQGAEPAIVLVDPDRTD
ncbi:flippase activity-associated protein Agl23 [Halorarius litoreus]|uniref:flippase activity-associated protein Agl23 n=1 Tax=Halorarius litoreus TaxID=2962676 RepID=UPI0020CD61F9|nr:flippase activity-associated protein Agl23 [Halorarius litoreus]